MSVRESIDRILVRLLDPNPQWPPRFPFFRILALSTVLAVLFTGWLWLMWQAWGWFIRLHCGA